MNKHKVNLWKISLTIGILVLGILITVGIRYKNSLSLLFVCRTTNIEDSCIQQEIFEYMNSHPLEAGEFFVQFASLRKAHLVRGDYRVFSSNLHLLGSLLYQNGYDPEISFSRCPAVIKDGCIHGYVMGYVAATSLDEGVALCKKFTNTRRYILGCYHALGHSFGEFSNGTLLQLLSKNICPHEGSEEIACIGGILHEYAKDGIGREHYNHYDRITLGSRISCNEVPSEYYSLCYGALGSFDQYTVDHQPLRQTLELCDTAVIKEAKRLCTFLAKERLHIARGSSAVPW